MSRFNSPITDLKPNGSLRFFESGTSTVMPTYKDASETIANPTIVTVLPNGNVENIFYTGLAKVLFLDEFGQQYAERDPVGTIPSSSGGGGGLGMWDNEELYNVADVVKGSNNKYYASIIASNIGNDPVSSSASWEGVRFIGVWSSDITYSVGDVVQTSAGNLWKALTISAGNDPEIDDGTNWLPAIDSAKAPEVAANTVGLAVLSSWEIPEVADFTGANNESRQIDASSNTVDITLPTLVSGDSFVYHNLITSTFKVQILNPTQTIKGTDGAVSAATNLEIEAGQSIQMVAASTTILSVTGATL